MKLKNILFTIFLLINLSFFAQKKTTSTSKKPASIYTQSNLLDKNSFSFINKKLKLNNLNFVFVNQEYLTWVLRRCQYNLQNFLHSDRRHYKKLFHQHQ